MTHDPNDPTRTRPVDPVTPRDTHNTTHNTTYVEPVEKRSSALPLIIGVLLALALAYFVLQQFTGDDDTVAVDGDTTTVTTTDAPAATAADTAADEAEAAAVEAETAAENAADATEDAAEDAAAAAGAAADAAGEAVDDAITVDEAPATTAPAPAN